MAAGGGRAGARSQGWLRHSLTFASDVVLLTFSYPERIADIVPDGLVRIESIALKHHGDVAVARLELRHIPLADQDAPFRRHVEARRECAMPSSCRIREKGRAAP